MWGVGLKPSEDSRDFNYSGSPRIEIIEIIEIGPISSISIIEMVRDPHPQHPKEEDFNYFGSPPN